MLYTAPVKSKRSADVIEAFEKLFEKAQAKPWRLMTDRGVEFVAKPLMDYYDKKDIIKKVAYTNDEVKCAMVERANRTLLERLYKYFSEKNTLEWVGILEKIVSAINNTVHTTTGVRPIDVTYENANDIREDLINQRDSTTTRNAQFKEGYDDRHNMWITEDQLVA
uniref:Integrase catalytic domain-containing protein n=1 Tax=Acrobeloides nanus TaxID=290746 RepID=A0A914EDT9_9BILA